MARFEFSANLTHLPKHPRPRPRPRPRPPPPSGRVKSQKPVDYISELPDSIILHILSFLTTNDAVKTSVLSKRWRSTWTANPRLYFSMPWIDDGTMFQSFMAFVDAVLLSCTAIKVKSFLFDARFIYRFRYRQSRIERWLHFAVWHDVEEVSMILHNVKTYALPRFFLHCTTLVSLHVSRCRFPNMGAVNWCSLKRLRIDDAELADNTIMRVLSGSPVLEFVELNGCWGFEYIKVESSGLRELVIDSHQFRGRQILKISAPHLLKLRLLGNYVGGEFKVDKVSSLVEAELKFDLTEASTQTAQAGADLVKNLLQSLHHVTKLEMRSYYFQVLSLTEARGRFLPSLECRHLMFHIAVDYPGVPGMVKILESSPRLEKLFLRMNCYPSWLFCGEDVDGRDFDAEEFWNSADRRINPCLMHLKNVEIVDPGSDWKTWEPMLSLVKFLLQNAPRLDKIEINSENSTRSLKADQWLLLEVARVILSNPNRSPSLKVVLSYPSQGCLPQACLNFDFHVSPDVIFSSFLYT